MSRRSCVSDREGRQGQLKVSRLKKKKRPENRFEVRGKGYRDDGGKRRFGSWKDTERESRTGRREEQKMGQTRQISQATARINKTEDS